MSFFNELKRRNVIRVGVAYLIIGWLLVQVLELAADSFEAPAWVMKMIITGLAVAFIPTLLFSWAYELTPEGLKKDKDVDKTTSDTSHTAKKLDIVTLVAVVGIAALIGWQQFNPPATTPAAEQQVTATSSQEDAPSVQSESTSPVVQSIAVLPFVALSTNADDEFFGKGIAEELLNALAQFPELKVAARTSAFSFGNVDLDIRNIGEALGVAHVLEGSVRRSNERLRITAQLIRAKDGFHLWSDTFERQDTDIFAIQDEIVSELSQVLQFRLGVGAGAGRAVNQNTDPRAYEEYLRGLDLWWNRQTRANRDNAIATFRRVTELDPNFADGWSSYGASLALSNVSNAPTLTAKAYRKEVSDSLARALELEPENIRAHAALVFWHTMNDINIPKARTHLEKGEQLASNDPFMIYASALFYWGTGDVSKSMELFNHHMALDPLNQTVIRNRFPVFVVAGRYAQEVDTVSETHKCPEGECKNIPAAWSLIQAALMSSDEQEFVQRRDNFSDLVKNTDRVAPYMDLLSNYVDSLTGQTVDAQYWKTVDISQDPIQESATIAASILAANGEVPLAIELLFDTQKAIGQTFGSSESFYALYPGRLEVPDVLRRHPKYHEYWKLPGMQGLADARRANGQTAGLPLPIDRSDP